MQTVTRENWRQAARDSGLTLVELAARTEVSFSTVYAYSRKARRPTDAWIERAGSTISAYIHEWTCKACGVRNAAERHGCRGCARAFDGYDPAILRPTGHGIAQ